MKMRLICVGKLKEQYFTLAVNEYVKRLTPYAEIEIVEIAESRLNDHPNPAQIRQGLQQEGLQILKRIKEDEYVIALDLDGESYTSPTLANHIDELMTKGHSTITSIIGSSYGLSDIVKARSNEKITLSRLTFPHQLVRVIWLEQLYRAFKILRHETYHK